MATYWENSWLSLPVLQRVIDEGSLPEIVQYGPSSSFVFLLLLKDLTIIFIFIWLMICFHGIST